MGRHWPELSKALTSLVAQLQTGGDPLLDSQASSSGVSLGSKGSLGRMQLQTELSNRSGQWSVFLASHSECHSANKAFFQGTWKGSVATEVAERWDWFNSALPTFSMLPCTTIWMVFGSIWH